LKSYQLVSEDAFISANQLEVLETLCPDVSQTSHSYSLEQI